MKTFRDLVGFVFAFLFFMLRGVSAGVGKWLYYIIVPLFYVSLLGVALGSFLGAAVIAFRAFVGVFS